MSQTPIDPARAAAHQAEKKAQKAAQDAAVKQRTASRGVVVVHTGDGKGKSTAGFGVAIRAAGHGQRVGVVQFVKGTWATGEQAALRRFDEIDHVVAGDGFTWNSQDLARDIASAEAGWAAARALIEGGEHDVVVLDELNIALRYDYLDLRPILEVLAARPAHVSVVITGRDAKPALIDAADTVTEHRVVKHAWQQGVRARKGVEF